MKRIIETDEGGFTSVLGEKLTIICGIYIYTGKLKGVNADHIELSEAKIVYETGDWQFGDWKDAQSLSGDVWRVQIAAIESWGAAKC